MIIKFYFYISTENIYAIQYTIHIFIKIKNAFKRFTMDLVRLLKVPMYIVFHLTVANCAQVC